MIDLVETVKNAMRIAESERVAVGVSGGRDSMCLLHALVRGGFAPRICAVHVNHHLRETAMRDAEFVREFCARNGVRFLLVNIDVKREAALSGLTIEQAARNLRYNALFDLVKSGAASYVLTAHHALDNAESVLMHIFRGAGLDGLCGMEKHDISRRIIRPLIDVYPKDLDEYAQSNKLSYVTDETNFIDDADRNFIRLNVLPLIEQRYRGAVRSVNELARECKSACAALDKRTEPDKIFYDRGATCIALDALDGELAGRYVRRALECFSLVDVTREQIAGVISLKLKRAGAVAELANGVKAERESDCVALYIPREKYDGERELCLGANAIDGLCVRVERTNADPKLLSGWVADFDRLKGAVVRFRRDGDVFTPFGAKQKKLKQYFTDNKIPNRIKDRTPLICRGNEVLAVVGKQVSDNVKVTDETVNRVVITV